MTPPLFNAVTEPGKNVPAIDRRVQTEQSSVTFDPLVDLYEGAREGKLVFRQLLQVLNKSSLISKAL